MFAAWGPNPSCFSRTITLNRPWLRGLARPVETTLLQIPKALAASCFGAALDFGLLVLLVEVCGWQPLAAATMSYLLPCVVGYFICAYWIFPTQPKKVTTGLAVFLVLALGGLFITWGTMGLLFELLGASYTLAKV